MVVLDVVIILCGYSEMLFNRLGVASELADGMGLLRALASISRSPATASA